MSNNDAQQILGGTVESRAQTQLGVLRQQKERLEAERQSLLEQARKVNAALAEIGAEINAVQGGIISLEFALNAGG